MEWMTEATAFDILILLIFLAFLVRGIWIGFISQISSLLAMLGGFFLAGHFDNGFYRFILPYFSDPHTAFLITYIILFVAFFYLIKLLGLGLKKVMEITLTAWFDKTMGGLFGVIKGVFVASLVFIITTSYLSGSNKYLKKSLTYPYLVESSKVLLMLIRDYDLRSYFIPKQPAIDLQDFDKMPGRAELSGQKDEAEAGNAPDKWTGEAEEKKILLEHARLSGKTWMNRIYFLPSTSGYF